MQSLELQRFQLDFKSHEDVLQCTKRMGAEVPHFVRLGVFDCLTLMKCFSIQYVLTDLENGLLFVIHQKQNRHAI